MVVVGVHLNFTTLEGCIGDFSRQLWQSAEASGEVARKEVFQSGYEFSLVGSL